MTDTPESDRIGRFARAELEAMRGKRGRKPPEYFELFPELKREASTAAPRPRTVAPAAPVVERCAEPAVAYDDPLASRLARAPAAARKLVEDLLDLLGVDAAGPRTAMIAVTGASASSPASAARSNRTLSATSDAAVLGVAGTAPTGMGLPAMSEARRPLSGAVTTEAGADAELPAGEASAGQEPAAEEPAAESATLRADPVYADPEAETEPCEDAAAVAP